MDARRHVPRPWIRSAEVRGKRRYENGNQTTTIVATQCQIYGLLTKLTSWKLLSLPYNLRRLSFFKDSFLFNFKYFENNTLHLQIICLWLGIKQLYVFLLSGFLSLRWRPRNHVTAQRAYDLKMTSYKRRYDVITSHRRRYDIILAIFARWVAQLSERSTYQHSPKNKIVWQNPKSRLHKLETLF